MDSSKIKALIVAILAIFVALYLGIAAATAQMEAVLWVVGGVGLAVCLLLGRRIYLLIPLMSSLSLSLPIPGHFSTGLIAQATVLTFLLMLFLMRRLPMRGGFTELEFWCLLLIATVGQAYMRHPVGLSIFGTNSVGAKPYATFAVTTLTAIVLSFLVIDPKDFKIWVRLSFIGSILNFAVGALGVLSPRVGYFLGASFSTDVTEGAAGVSAGPETATRIAFVRKLSVALATWVSSRISPLRACFRPLWLPLILLSFALAGISGYRSQLIWVGLIYFLGVCYRGGFSSVVASFFIGATGLVLLAFGNAIAPLPLNIQRSLSFLPGSWDRVVKEGSQHSTDWRVEMWQEALFTEHWIENKIIGDGLGFTKSQHAQMLALGEGQTGSHRGTKGMSNQQETMMITGDYHSGPVQTIRTTGYVGLVVLIIAMIRVAVHAHRQIQRSRGSEWYPSTLFIGIPLIVLPIFWTLIFGTFSGGISAVLLGTAIIRMLEKNLPLPAYIHGRRNRYPAPNGNTITDAVAH